MKSKARRVAAPLLILEDVWVCRDIPSKYFPKLSWTQGLIDRIEAITGSFVNFGMYLGLVLLFLMFILLENTLSRRKFRRAFPRNVSVTPDRAVEDVTRQVAQFIPNGTGLRRFGWPCQPFRF